MVCDVGFKSKRLLATHNRTNKHKNKVIATAPNYTFKSSNILFEVRKEKSAFARLVEHIHIVPAKVNTQHVEGIPTFLDTIEGEVVTILNVYLKDVGKEALKFNANVRAIMKKFGQDNEIIEKEHLYKSSTTTLLASDNVVEKLKQNNNAVITDYENMQSVGSGWTLEQILGYEITVHTYDPLRTGSYIALSGRLKRLNNVINVKNRDNKCFYYCIYAKFSKKDTNDPESYKTFPVRLYQQQGIQFNFDDINYPATFKDVERFEKNNPRVSINIFGVKGEKAYPIKIILTEKEIHYDLLYVKNNTTSHYILITNFNKFIRPQLTKHKRAIAICKRCFKYYTGSSKDHKLMEHKGYCGNEDMKEASIRQMPKPGSTLQFGHAFYSYPVHFVVFADFESMFEELKEESRREHCTTLTRKEAKHKVITYTYYIVTKDNHPYKDPVTYVGEDAAQHFYNKITKDAAQIEEEYRRYPVVPHLTDEERRDYEEATHCCICAEEFKNEDGDVAADENDQVVELDGAEEEETTTEAVAIDPSREKKGKVIHHCHATNRYLGAALSTPCNINAKNRFLPVFFHNMSKYDGKFVALTLDTDMMYVRVIPQTEEEYTCITKGISKDFSLRFVDSHRFMTTSLRKLVEITPSNQLSHTR